MFGRLPLSLLILVAGVLAAADEGSVADYAPQTNVACPDTSSDGAQPLVRIFSPNSQALNAHEKAYIEAREAQEIPNAWKDWVGDGSAIGYDTSQFGGNWSRIGIAISGGGYRAAQYGAGVLSGLDARNESAKNAGTGGLLQVASYLSALSGESRDLYWVWTCRLTKE
jgi:lysophospholipase